MRASAPSLHPWPARPLSRDPGRSGVAGREPPDSDLPHQHLARYGATITGPGGSLIERDAWREYDTGDSATFTGLPIRLLIPGGGVLVRDAGFVTFTDEGISVVHGPHPTLEEFDFADVCSYLV